MLVLLVTVTPLQASFRREAFGHDSRRPHSGPTTKKNVPAHRSSSQPPRRILRHLPVSVQEQLPSSPRVPVLQPAPEHVPRSSRDSPVLQLGRALLPQPDGSRQRHLTALIALNRCCVGDDVNITGVCVDAAHIHTESSTCLLKVKDLVDPSNSSGCIQAETFLSFSV